MNPFEMMKNLSNMKSKVKEFQANLDKTKFTATSIDNGVSVSLNGKFELINFRVDREWMIANMGTAEQTIKETLTDALLGVKAKIKEQSSNLTGGMDLSELGL